MTTYGARTSPAASDLPTRLHRDLPHLAALWAACTATGFALFAAQRAISPALRRNLETKGTHQ